MHALSRRGFLAASAATISAAQLPRLAFAQTAAPIALAATTRTLDINGRAATVFGLAGPGGQGLTFEPGDRFRVDLTNDLDVPTIVHWHGQIPPNALDGAPNTAPLLAPGETWSYDFETRPSTYWVHAHVATHETRLLAAPLIVRAAEDLSADQQEVVLFLHNFSFKAPEEVLEEIAAGGGEHGSANAVPEMQDMSDMQGVISVQGMGSVAMDLSDYNWDAYFANDRTLSDPEVVQVERGGRLRLRVITAAAATVFWIQTGAAQTRLVAVDGDAVQPVSGSRFGLAMSQRLDLEIDLPNEDCAWPILALREGARERTGLILATQGAEVRRIAALGESDVPASTPILHRNFA